MYTIKLRIWILFGIDDYVTVSDRIVLDTFAVLVYN